MATHKVQTCMPLLKKVDYCVKNSLVEPPDPFIKNETLLALGA